MAESNKPPVSDEVPAGTSKVISFPNQFLGVAESIVITNLDASNIATYQINGESNPTLTLTTGGERTIDKTVISTIKITAGAAGAVQVQAQVKPLVK